MKLDSQGLTDVGNAREINQDYFYIDNTRGLFIVCDGVGGHAAGEVASHRAIEFTIEYLCQHWDEIESADQTPTGYYKLTQLVERAIHETCMRIKSLAEIDPGLNGMATTLTLLLIVDGNAIVGHVGDSRLYIKRADRVFQLTTDHTLYNEMVSSFPQVDPHQIRKFRHCLTRSVGSSNTVAVETLMFEAAEHDVLLLCTDGLSNYFDNETVVAEMLNGGHVNDIAKSLVQFANRSGGSDNITALVIRILDVHDFLLNTHRITLALDENDQEKVIEPKDSLPRKSDDKNNEQKDGP